jgi:hypothetical protein
MSKKFWIAFAVTFVLFYALEFVLHGVCLKGLYQAHPEGFLMQGEAQSRMWALTLGVLLWAYLWTYFFHRFATKKTVANGIRHGMSYMIFILVPTGLTNWANEVIYGGIFFWWAVGGIVQGAIVGAVMGAILKGEE